MTGTEETVSAAVETDPGTVSTRSPSTTLGLVSLFSLCPCRGTADVMKVNE